MKTNQQRSVWTTSHKVTLGALLAAQLAIAYFVGAGHLLTNTGLVIFPPIAITVFVPVALFLTAYATSGTFRNFVLAQDLRLLTALQLWRVVGFSFLLLYAFDVLPGLFAWPAGLGDTIVGLAAFYVLMQMDRDPDYGTSSGYVRFQLFGLLDFIGALGTSGLASGAIPGLVPGGVTSAAMDIWPLNLFPSFIVPVFIILQLTALLKVRELRRQSAGQQAGNLQAV